MGKRTRDPDFDWNIRLRGMTVEEVAAVIEKVEERLTREEAQLDECRKSWAAETTIRRTAEHDCLVAEDQLRKAMEFAEALRAELTATRRELDELRASVRGRTPEP